MAPFSQNSKELRMLRIRPGAARAVEAMGLVHRQQRLGALDRDALLAKRPGRGPERAPAAGRALIRLEGGAVGGFRDGGGGLSAGGGSIGHGL